MLPSGHILSDHLWVFGDASGGKFAVSKAYRRVGCAAVVLKPGSLDPLVGFHFNLTYEDQEVGLGELLVFPRVLRHLSLGTDLCFVSDRKSVV